MRQLIADAFNSGYIIIASVPNNLLKIDHIVMMS